MELMLTFGVLFAAIAIYLPGYIMARGLAIDRFGSLALAPLFTLPLVTIVGVVLYEIWRPISGGVYFAIVLACALLFFALGRVVGIIAEHRGSHETPTKPLLSFSLSTQIWQTALLYVSVALLVCFFVYISALATPDAFSRNDDTTVHLSLVRGFIDSGTYSTLHASSFLDWGVSGSYYPSTWHCIVAMVASVLGGQVTIATNATIIATCVFVIPLGVLLLLATLFPHQPTIVRSGALFTIAFSAFPWGFITFGQLLPNLLSFALVAPTMATLISATSEKHSRLARLIAVTVIGIAALVAAQPNGVFTWGILATLYLINNVLYRPDKESSCRTWRQWVCAALILTGACLLWTGLHFAPFLQSVVSHSGYTADLSVPEAILAALSFMFVARGSIQPLLSVFVLLGVIWTCKHRRYLWLTIALAFSFGLYVFSVSNDPNPLRQFLCGFWYADYHRLATMAAMFAIPLAACGFAWTVSGIHALVKRLSPVESSQKVLSYTATGILVVLLAASQLIPLTVDLGNKRVFSFGLIHTRSEIAQLHSWDVILTGEERAFIQEVQSIIPQEALVVNAPHDGSAWAYGTDGINVLFRRASNSGSNPLAAEENALIRTQLADITTEDDIAELMHELDARYLLLLDAPDSTEPTKTPRRYEAGDWVGIETINENTPGFTLLLSEGDMRLYEIAS